MKTVRCIALILSCIVTIVLEAMPAQVMIIRHAEKPAVGNGLSPIGLMRAKELVSFFTKSPEVLKFGPLAAIYAARPGKEDGSVRAMQTVAPLAAAMKMQVNSAYTAGHYLQMVEEIKINPAYQGKSVLICWEHHVIPEIARAFGVLDAPMKWHGHIFDRVWLLTFEPGGLVAFQEFPERL
ncbi:MAG: hypothetical protein LLG04_04830 [Parachlamydia sp.]|nr:hypothetical protein [Parachlamydia sp.]